MKLKVEKEISEAIQTPVRTRTGHTKAAATDFIARRDDVGDWVVEFSYYGTSGYYLGLKRGGVKKFSTLDTAYNCLAKLGVNEFTVTG